MKDKAELLTRARQIVELKKIRGFEKYLTSDYNCTSPDVLRIEDLENCDEMTNFLIDLTNIMEKYEIKGSGVNGHWNNFCFGTDKNAIRVGVSQIYYFLLSEKEMNKQIEDAKEYARQEMLRKRVQLIPMEEEGSEYVSVLEDEPSEETETDIKEPKKTQHIDFAIDIEGKVKVKSLDTFENEDEKRNQIYNVILKELTYWYFDLKDENELLNKIQLEVIESDGTYELYRVTANNINMVYTYNYSGEFNETTANNELNNELLWLGRNIKITKK